MRHDDDRESELAELRWEERMKRARDFRLMMHPDPTDPDWPGHEEDQADQAEN